MAAVLFSLFLFLPSVLATPVHFQTLVLSPLQNPTPFAQTLAEAPASTSPFYLPVAHIDSFLAGVNSTAGDLFLLRLRRDAARVSVLSSAVRRNRTFTTPVVSGLSQGSGEYFARIGVGTPAVQSYFVLDTGSDVVWLQCAPCRQCYHQAGPIFDPRRSRSYVGVTCSSRVCHRLDSAGCDTRRQACLYEVSYGDGSVTAGDFSRETLSFAGGSRVGRVALGCGHDNEGLFVAASGLLGLGRGPLSFPSQLARRAGRRFSYCLVDRTSSSAPRASYVTFGNAAVPANTVFTPMVRNPKMRTFYYVELTGVSVGGTRVAGLTESDLRLDPQTGRGGVIVDSGTSVTRLARSAYVAVRDAFRAGAIGLKQTLGGFSLFDTCYDLSGKTEVKVPTVAMHFAGGAEVALPPENYLIPVDTKGTFCFAFAGTDGGVSIIGNIQQQGFRVVFDGEKQRVGFVPRGC